MNNYFSPTNQNSILLIFSLFIALFLASCDDSDEAEVDPCDGFALSVSGSESELTLAIEEGTPPYRYEITYTGGETQSGSISSGDTTITADAHEGATIVVTDESMCSESVTLAEGALSDPCAGFTFEASAYKTSITLDITGGVAPYGYLITYASGETQSEEAISNTSLDIVADFYEAATITLTDDLGCELTATIAAGALDPCVDFEAAAIGSDGEITLTIEGGVAPYAYEIVYEGSQETQTGITEDTEMTLAADETTDAVITITDAEGCEIELEVTEDELSSLYDFRDGQRYGIVEINGVYWLSENFNYDDGTGLCYDDKEENCAEYGKLYTWTAATADGFAPEGWSLPTQVQIEDLQDLLGGQGGTDLKEEGSTGFEAKLAGFYTDEYGGLEEYTYFWSQSEVDDEHAYAMSLAVSSGIFDVNSEKVFQFSVRLVKD